MNTFKQILNLLSPQEKKRAILLLILILLTAFIDVLGVASILPFIGLLTNPELIETNRYLSYLYSKSNLIGIDSSEQFLFAIGIIVFVILIISLFIRALSNYAQIRFALMREFTIGKRLFEGYLSQPYTWFLDKNSSDFAKNILSEVSNVIHQAVIPLISLIAQSTVTIAMLILIILANPQIAFTAGSVLLLTYGGVFYFVKKYLSNIGIDRTAANQQRFKEFNDAFGAIKELKLNGLEINYIKRFSISSEIFAKTHSTAQLFSQLPRYIIEAIAFGGMIILVLFLIYENNNLSEVIPLIALYAFVGYRLIPATQIIFGSLSLIRFSGSALNSLHKDLANLKQLNRIKIPLDRTISLSHSINLQDITYNYPTSTKQILKNINIQIPALNIVGIVGSTGSGKTTLVDLMLGLLELNKGEIKADQEVINKQNIRLWQKNIGYVPQNIFLSDLSIAENVAFGKDISNIDLQAVKDACKIANIHDFIENELSNGYKTLVGENGVRLSGGQKQRIGIARALYKKPSILILDEATSALDTLTEKKVMNDIQTLRNKITIIIISHRLSTLKKCNKIFLLEKGEINAHGTYEELIKGSDSFLNMALS